MEEGLFGWAGFLSTGHEVVVLKTGSLTYTISKHCNTL
jgi:hypothetical protein